MAKNKKSVFKYIFQNLLIALSGIIIVLIILDFENPTMNFLRDSINQRLLVVFCALVIINSSACLIKYLNEKDEIDTKK